MTTERVRACVCVREENRTAAADCSVCVPYFSDVYIGC